MKFLVDRCAGRKLADWLRSAGHDTVESRELGADPGDLKLLEFAASEQRAVVTIDTDFGKLAFVDHVTHAGIIRLPDVPPQRRIEFLKDVIERHTRDIESGAIITVRGGRIRISRPAPAENESDPNPSVE